MTHDWLIALVFIAFWWASAVATARLWDGDRLWDGELDLSVMLLWPVLLGLYALLCVFSILLIVVVVGTRPFRTK